tara:strand:- start:151 stop:882 length:732 start_codon:yes stop_codon:yes gene_type:complete
MDTLQKQGAYIQGSNKAKETLFTTDLIKKATKKDVGNWVKNVATDDEISALAIDSGWEVDADIIIPSAIANTVPSGVKKVIAKIVTSKGLKQDVGAYNLSFLKTRTEDVYHKDPVSGKGVKTGQKILAFIFNFGDQTIKTYSLMLMEAFRTGELAIGDIIPFKADSCNATHVPANGDNKAYHFWQGGTLEAGSELMQDARAFIERRDAHFATMSLEGQLETNARKASREADEYEAMFCKPVKK